jgi:hypothetical protein
MATVIAAKRSTRRWDCNPRIVRKKKPEPALNDDPLYYRDEKSFRTALWHGLARLARECNAWIVTPPNEGRVRIQMAEGSPLLERLAAFPRYPIIRIGKTTRLAHGKFMDVDIVQVQLWRGN